ncbi:MAG TPA: hypothetical protein VF584_17345 [Longimicrobium sp.]
MATLDFDDQRNLDMAMAPACAPRDPVQRQVFLETLREDKLTLERVIQLMLGSAYGHVLKHHCMTSFSLNLDPETLLKAFVSQKSKKKDHNRGVFTRVSVAYRKAEREEITAETVLRCRVIGMSLETMTLPDKPEKCTACAFTSRTSAVAAAQSVSYMFLRYIRRGNARRSGPIGVMGEGEVTYNSGKEGYALVSPISRVGHDVASGVCGFTTTLKFDEIAATITELVAKLNPQKTGEWNKLLMLVLKEVTVRADLTRGTVRTIYKNDKTPNGFYIFSMYPEPSPKKF